MILFWIICLPLLAFFNIIFIKKHKIWFLKQISLFWSILIFFLSLVLLLKFKPRYFYIQFYKLYDYFPETLSYSVGVDGISIFFVVLTTLLIPICLLVNISSVKFRFKEFALLLFFLEFLLINVFSTLNIFFFYIFFESVLIPMFLIIGIWGSRQRKIHAVFQFFFYTFIGSILLLSSFLIIYLHTGCVDIEYLRYLDFSYNRQLVLWLGFFLAFAIKVPMIPFHIWLPEAHVEAPTTGSILLAGILLKLGTYGFMRFLIPLFPYGFKYFSPFVITICVLSIIYGSFVTIRQIDLKKIIAYSSVVHMNFAIIGLFCNNLLGYQGSIFLMLSHGLISSALFLCIGILYDRYHTRVLFYYGGLVQFMPIFSTIFLIFTLSNMGFPLTSGFIGEILIFMSLFSLNNKIAILVTLSMVFSAIYSIWLYNRLIFGELKKFSYIKKKKNIIFIWFKKFSDISREEFYAILPLFILNIILGIYPNFIFNITYLSIIQYFI